jgi:hypothetical protein
VNQGEDDRDPKSVDFPTAARTPELPRFKYGGNPAVHDGVIHWIATQEGRAVCSLETAAARAVQSLMRNNK